jgi:hypothetical protein
MKYKHQILRDMLTNRLASQKQCVIINGTHAFILKTDGKEITFHGFEAAEYFEAHYKGLGYNVIKEGW